MQHLFNNCASFVQYLSISFNSFLVFVEHFQGGATQICVFLCIFEFAHAPRCVFEVLPMMASRQGCLVVFSVFWLDPGRKTLFSELCNICAILQKYLLDNENICAMIVQYLEYVFKVFVSSNWASILMHTECPHNGFKVLLFKCGFNCRSEICCIA